MDFGQAILAFFEQLQPPKNLPREVEILWPYDDAEVRRVMHCFYCQFLCGVNTRVFLVGINPGRFGAGVTGIGFTDPVQLAGTCGIAHSLVGGRELSSEFMYKMIAKFGGPEYFYRYFYVTALSPVGFLRGGKNLNYYDVKGLAKQLDGWMALAMAEQIKAGADCRVAYSIGQGANFKALEAFNQRYNFFNEVLSLPHPRWIMQYRRRQMDEFIDLYIDTLRPLCFA